MYVAIEQKVKLDGTYEVSTFKKATREEAEKAYHSILSGAATSEHLVHSAIVLNEFGQVIRPAECYKHEPPKPEPEPEPTPDPEPEEDDEPENGQEGEPEEEPKDGEE